MTQMDPRFRDSVPIVGSRIVKYLYRNVQREPWYPHLFLTALLLSACAYDEVSVYTTIGQINTGLRAMFATEPLARKLTDMDSLRTCIDECLQVCLVEGLRDTSQASCHEFYVRYRASTGTQQRWLSNLSSRQREDYEPWLLPVGNAVLHSHLAQTVQLTEATRQRRKEETDAVMPLYVDLRYTAHRRFNWFARFRQAYREALQHASNTSKFPFDYAFDYDGQLWQLRIWTVEALTYRYGKLMRCHRPEPSTLLVEVLSVVESHSGAQIDPASALWFAEPQRHMGAHRTHEHEARAWYKSWGYAFTTAFKTDIPSLLSYHPGYMHVLQQILGHPAFIVDAIYYALAFGLLAIDIFTTTGARLNEAMQISLSPECIVRLIYPTVSAPNSNSASVPKIHYSLRLVPKGQRKNIREDFFIGTETKRLLARVAQMLIEHYELKDGQPLPTVPFCPLHRRAHRFGPSPYIFQFLQRHVSHHTISSCVRFILHGIVLQTESGKPFAIRAHLLRHGFATHAVQVEKIPLDIVGAWMHQKSLPVTSYYSRPTRSMIADAAGDYLAKIARSIDVEQAVLRSPPHLQRAYQEAVVKTGTLANVVGGHCTSHGLCKVQFACVGCSAKVPDPDQREQVEHRREWAKQELEYSRQQQLLPEAARLESLIRAADLELREMDLIEQYRAEELPS
ncbi:hypothetical protein [Ralstonia mannitolilytica]|uniref:hypothetical protein n=1 Tax=Ralstonia mannitolilytica TaxID=105219 RepID=UPI002931CC15|nr:hypothetical protein [Ralstonia mannitolilytica]